MPMLDLESRVPLQRPAHTAEPGPLLTNTARKGELCTRGRPVMRKDALDSCAKAGTDLATDRPTMEMAGGPDCFRATRTPCRTARPVERSLLKGCPPRSGRITPAPVGEPPACLMVYIVCQRDGARRWPGPDPPSRRRGGVVISVRPGFSGPQRQKGRWAPGPRRVRAPDGPARAASVAGEPGPSDKTPRHRRSAGGCSP